MSFEIILYIIAGFFGIVLSLQDFKNQKVGIIPLFGFTVTCVFLGYFTKKFCFIPFFIFLGIGLILYIFKRKQAFGMADYIMIFAISFILPSDSWHLFIMLCGVFGILCSLILKKKKSPFLPVIFLTSMIIKILFEIN